MNTFLFIITYTHPYSIIKNDVEKLPIMLEEVDYEVKTRTPMPDLWKLNILRGVKANIIR